MGDYLRDNYRRASYQQSNATVMTELKLGEKRSFSFQVDKHFNRFQKKMLEWCFGFVVSEVEGGG